MRLTASGFTPLSLYTDWPTYTESSSCGYPFSDGVGVVGNTTGLHGAGGFHQFANIPLSDACYGLHTLQFSLVTNSTGEVVTGDTLTVLVHPVDYQVRLILG